MGDNEFAKGGEGAFLKAEYTVNGGDELTIFVGHAGYTGGSPAGGGGTAVIINSLDVLIASAAGGGGGNGSTGGGGLANTDSNAEGGIGVVASGGGGFNSDGEDGQSGTGGKAGTLTIVGDGGIGGLMAGNGGSGFGGGAGGGGTGGGGGGGYNGGNGGVTGELGGLGGDSFVNTGYSSIVITANAGSDGGSNKEDGYVVIKCLYQSGIELDIVIDDKSNPSCFGKNDGSILVAGTGGVLPYLYSLDGGAFSLANYFGDLGAGVYTITVMDDIGDTDEVVVTLEEPDELFGIVLQVVYNYCGNGQEGIIEVEGSGGTVGVSGYLYSLDGGAPQSSGLFTDLENGEYTITIIDEADCRVEVVEEIDSPDAVEITIVSKKDVSCFGYADGSIAAQAVNGDPPYSYSLNDIDFQDSNVFDNLIEGHYTVYVKDENGCLAEIDTFISEPSKLELVIDSIDGGCVNESNGYINVHGIGGSQPFTYILNNTDTSFSGIFNNLYSGNYMVDVFDTNLCLDSDTIILEEETDTLKLEVQLIHNVTCFNGNDAIISVIGSGGSMPYQYILNGVDTSLTGQFNSLVADTYIIEVIEFAGCSVFDTITILEPDSFYYNIINVSNVSCLNEQDGIVNVVGSGGMSPYTYIMNDTIASSTGLFENLSPGTYFVEVKDSNNCAYSSSIVIEEGSDISVTIENIYNIDCYGENSGSVSLMISGGHPEYIVIFDSDTSILVSDGIFYKDSLFSGTHLYTVLDSSGCEYSDTIILTQNDLVALVVDSLVNADCNTGTTGTVYLSASGGVSPFNYTVSGNSSNNGVFLDLEASDYYAEVVDSLGCVASTTFTMEQNGGVEIEDIVATNVSCFGFDDGSIEIIPQNTSKTYTYKLGDKTNTTGFFDSLVQGDYSISVTDDQNCELFIFIGITEPDELVVNIVDSLTINGTIIVFVTGGVSPYKYSIDKGNNYKDENIFEN